MSKPFYITTPDLLRECASPHRTCLHDDRLRHDRPPPSHAGRRHLVSDRHRRARTEDRASRAGRAERLRSSSPTKSPTRSVQAWERLGLSYDDFIRTTSDRHKQGVQALWRKIRDNGLHLQRHVHRPVLRLRRTLRGMSVRPERPALTCGRPTETVHEENYYFKLSAFADKLMQLYTEQSGFHPSGDPAQRGDVVCARRPAGSLDQP